MIVETALIASLCTFIVLERLVNASVVLATRLAYGTEKGDTGVKGYAGVQVLGAWATYASTVGGALVSLLSTLLAGLASYLLWALTITVVFSLLFIAQEYYPEILVQFVDYYNQFIGPKLHTIVVVPAEIVDTVFSALVPIYDTAVWWFSQFFYNVIVTGAIRDFQPWRDLGVAVAKLFEAVSISFVDYVVNLAQGCPRPVTDQCFAPGPRTLDLITPMIPVRDAAVASSQILDGLCKGLTGPTDIATYPLVDINLAKGIHNTVNGVLFLFIQIWDIRTQRCAAHQNDLILCLPDFEPAFNFLCAGIRNFGVLLDNWFDVSSIIVQKSLGFDIDVDCEAVALALTPANYDRTVFGLDRQTVTVGLTEGLYAVTNGRDIQYFNHYDSQHTEIVPNAWPIDVDVTLGVAAVQYHSDGAERDAQGETGTTMLGCRCFDDDGAPPMRIQCALALHEAFSRLDDGTPLAAQEPVVFDVVFQQRSTANYMTCLESQISVQSVRFTRLSDRETDLDRTCQSKGTCNYVDATIFVAPLCTTSAARVQEVCSPTFRGASCYPYCMAARQKGSRANGLILYDANDWKERVHLMERDCGVRSQYDNPNLAVQNNQALFDDGGAQESDRRITVQTYDPDALSQGSVKTLQWDPERGCVESLTVQSNMGLDLHDGYTNNRFRSILMPGQPFAYAGDTVLTAVVDSKGQHFVSVDRLFGNEANEFTMVNVLSEFPASPPADTIKIEGLRRPPTDRLPVPNSFSDSGGVKHPAVSTQTAVYFAVNPSLNMFQAFASGCFSGGMDWQLQMSALSSYAPIRIWKINPYTYCPNGDDGTADCGPGLVAFKDIPGAFTEQNAANNETAFDLNQCYRPFAVEVSSLEYINAENIAVTVLRAPFSEFSPTTGRLKPEANNTERVVMFLSTVTMALSDTPHERDIPVRALAQGKLCPAMRRLPNVGSLGAELAVAGVNAVRTAVRIVISLPAVIEIWGKRQSCSLVTHGHSLLERCGSDLLSLDEFFDALNRANAHFWRSLAIVSENVRDLGGTRIANVVDGVAYYGEATLLPTPGGFRSMLRSIRVPTREVTQGWINGLLATNPAASFTRASVRSNPLRMAQFSYKLVTGAIVDLIPYFIRVDRDPADRDAARKILAVLTNRFYDARDAYYAAGTLGMLQACSGLSLAVGYTNPWAILLRKQCEVAPMAIQGVYDLALSMVVDVPFTKCICVDAARASDTFQHAIDNCYFFAPNYLKPTILDLARDIQSRETTVPQACAIMVEHATEQMETSMQPFFTTQLQAAQEVGNSVDYLLRFIDTDAGRCNDFASNPYSAVLIPEPIDYFTGCARTSFCEAKCYGEIQAFNAERERNLAARLQTTTFTRTQESLFFTDLNEDAFTPFKIAAMVQLSDCRAVCGGSVVPDERRSNANENVDTCIAAAGVAGNGTIVVKKYCIPRATGESVFHQESETWYVWYSEEWVSTAVELRFADVTSGDTLIALRDNRGKDLKNGPRTQFVTFHPREIQLDQDAYTVQYGTREFRNERLVAASTTTPFTDISGTVEGIVDIMVLPQDSSLRMPIVMLELLVFNGEAGVEESQRRDACFHLDVPHLIYTRGVHKPNTHHACELDGFFEKNRGSGTVPVVYPSSSQLAGFMALVPTRKGGRFCTARISFTNPRTLAALEEDCFPVPDEFVSNSKLPSVYSWTDIARTMLTGADEDNPEFRIITQEGIAVTAQKRLAQNSLSAPPLLLSQRSEVVVFATNDPSSQVHWLQQNRILVNQRSAANEVRSSQPVNITVRITHSCDLTSCLGCPTLGLQALCYAAQTCTVQRCIGTTVNVERPLCNVGTSLQSVLEQGVSILLGGWVTFTETYRTILKFSLRPETLEEGLRVEWVDDVFFSYVCTAKDMAGQGTAVFTSAVGAAIISEHRKMVSPVLESSGGKKIDDKFTANVALRLTSVNAFLYQMSLAPIYALIAMQKIFVCNTNSLMAIVDELGFSVQLGQADLQRASDAGVGECLSPFFESKVQDVNALKNPDDIATGANEILGNQQHSAPNSFNEVSKKLMGKFVGLYTQFSFQAPVVLLDALFTYLSGVVTGIQDVAQQFDAVNCKVIDYYISEATTCACGDDALEIPQANREKGLQDHAHWCTGTLRMIDGFSNEKFVYNPYSLEELGARLGTMDQYLDCISRKTQGMVNDEKQCFELEPRVDILDQQGVTGISVFMRCKANYQQKTWDSGAYMLYDVAEFARHIPSGVASPITPASGSAGECLVRANDNDESNGGCLQDYVRDVERTSLSYYWRYERVASTSTADTRNVDGCVVFSGPAKSANLLRAEPFRQCSDQYEDQGCKIPHMVWSASSRNRVPVANLHVVEDGTSEGRALSANRLFNDAYDEVQEVLGELENYVNDNLDVLLFSGEGDALHQQFDCAFQGPFSRVDMWPRGSENELPVPFWARDEGGLGLTREMDLPCIGDRLGGDTRPPFTCGSEDRRAIIKYFVRDFLSRGDSNQKNVNSNTLTEQLIRDRVAKLKEAWGDKSKYACLDPAGSGQHGLQYCRIYRRGEGVDATEGCELGGEDAIACENNFLPPSLNETFDEIPGEDVAKSIMEQVPRYMKHLMTDDSLDPWIKHNRGSPGLWNWIEGGLGDVAADEGLYHSHKPVVTYSGAEAGFPFRYRRSLWRTCVGLISQIMFTMPLRPLTVDEETGDWMWTAASVLALRTPQLRFDYTLPTNFDDPTGAPDKSGLSMLERYVGRLLDRSFSHSPLFWHYAMRHAPSDSLACARDLGSSAPGTRPPSSKLDFQNLAGIPNPFDEGRVPDYDMYGYAAKSLGALRHECFCGWDMPAAGECQLPAQICSDSNYTEASCRYAHGSDEGNALLARLLELWPEYGRGGAWECPDVDLSDSWGIVPTLAANDWILGTGATQVADIGDLLYGGRSGLRIGNADTLGAAGRAQGVWPSARVHPLASADGRSDVSIDRCASTIASTFDPESVAQQVADDLFPAAQGVYESAPMSVCLRFSIEFAKLQVVEMVHANIRESGDALRRQEAAVTNWKKRCEMQLQMLGVCRGYGVFEMVPENQPTDYECPFTISDAYRQNVAGDGAVEDEFVGRYYITPGCQVWIRDAPNPGHPTLVGAFFNPCRHSQVPCTGKPAYSLQQLLDDAPNTRLPFDPRATGSRDVLGTWPLEFTGGNASQNERLATIARELEAWQRGGREEVPWRLSHEFIKTVVEEGGSNAEGSVGNTRGAWGTSEGFASAGSAEFCDSIADWWPEDWTKPVGYHVTLPCDKDEAGYRTFDAAFAVDRGGEGEEFSVVRMRYQHDMARDPETFHSEFGGAGLCRRGSYGMPRFVTNTMRVCTRDASDVQYDAAVPVLPKFAGGSETFSGDEYCSESPYDTPWTIKDRWLADPNSFSVGNVPLYKGEDFATTTKYPVDSRIEKVMNRNPGVPDHSWGESCTDGDLLRCETSADCQAVAAGVELECFRNLCILSRASTQTCYRHADCEDQGKLCSGDGICVYGTWQVDNHFENDIEFELYATECGANEDTETYQNAEYDMFGASPWESVPDILRLYGLCSYRDWFEMLQFTEPETPELANLGQCTGELAQSIGCNDDEFNADLATWWETRRENRYPDMRVLWDVVPEKFRVQAHPCDRQYQRIRGTRGCTPIIDEGKSVSGYVDMAQDIHMGGYAARGRNMQTYRRIYADGPDGDPQRFISMKSVNAIRALHNADPVKWADYKRFGFMSMPAIADNQFRYCRDVSQCQQDVFTYHGVQKDSRQVVRVSALEPHTPQDAENCGIFSFRVDASVCTAKDPSFSTTPQYCCQIDRAVAPYWEAICDPGRLRGGFDANPLYNDRIKPSCKQFSSIQVENICRQLDTGLFTVPTNDVEKREMQIADIRDKLNSLIDEFAPDVAITTATHYVQAIDCSQALYSTIQTATECPLDEFGSRDTSHPYCTPYHTSADYSSRASVYYMMSYSMQEVPFAWIHKCMYLHSRTFRAGGDVIQCPEWDTGETIPRSQFLGRPIDYADDVLGKLRRVEGGVNTTMLSETRQKFQEFMAFAIRGYVRTATGTDAADPGDGDANLDDGGGPSLQEIVGDIRSELTRGVDTSTDPQSVLERLFSRNGISDQYNLRCYLWVKFKSRVRWLELKLGEAKGDDDTLIPPIDCRQQMLRWMFVDNGLYSVFSADNPWKFSGFTGVSEECYDYDLRVEQNQAEGGYVTPMKMLELRMLDEYGGILSSSLEQTDFLQASNNDAELGLLTTEFVAQELPEIPDIPVPDEFQGARYTSEPSTRRAITRETSSTGRYDSRYLPCISFEEMRREGVLECEDRNGPEPFPKDVCDKRRMEARDIIATYSKPIYRDGAFAADSRRSGVEKKRRGFLTLAAVGVGAYFAGKEIDCQVKKCWDNQDSEETLPQYKHAGLSDELRDKLMAAVEREYRRCLDAVNSEDFCYVPNDPSLEFSKLREDKLAGDLDKLWKDGYVQKVCKDQEGNVVSSGLDYLGALGRRSGAQNATGGRRFVGTIANSLGKADERLNWDQGGEGSGLWFRQNEIKYSPPPPTCEDVWGDTGNRVVNGVLQRLLWQEVVYKEFGTSKSFVVNVLDDHGRENYNLDGVYIYDLEGDLKTADFIRDTQDSMDELMRIMVGPLFDFYKRCGNDNEYGDTCYPKKSPLTRTTRFHPKGEWTADSRTVAVPKENADDRDDYELIIDTSDCFQVAIPYGQLKCGYDYDSGLRTEVANARRLRNQKLKTPASGRDLPWAVNEMRLLDSYEDAELLQGVQGTDIRTSKQFPKVLYTLYVRMVERLSKLGSYGGGHVKPQPIDFFEKERSSYLREFTGFNLASKRQFEVDRTQITQVCDGTAPEIDYGVCSDKYLHLYDSARAHVENFIREEGPPVVPPGSSLVWHGIRFAQQVSDTLPAWSLHRRERKDKFVDWLFDRQRRCEAGTTRNSICTTDYDTSEEVAVNPWLGGDFNPFERCDTDRTLDQKVEGVEGAARRGLEGGDDYEPDQFVTNERISLSCHKQICPNGATDPYYTNQPNPNCLTRQLAKQTQVQEENVPLDFASNLCSKRPHDNGGTCPWVQGMGQQGMAGLASDNLYAESLPVHVDDDLARHGKGLFVFGANPLYYTTKGSPDDIRRQVHTLIKQHREDLGGQHVVFRTAQDPITNEKYLHIDRTPLRGIPDPDPTATPHPSVAIHRHSTESLQTHGVFGWRSNLEQNMTYVEGTISDLYPIHREGLSNRKWSCPLRRIAFWTKLVSDFNPLTPSPPRAERLFGAPSGLHMNYNTRNHPTTTFRALDRVAEVYTSNGFCFCKEAGECSAMHGDPVSKCTFSQTVQSLYDRAWRRVENRDTSAECLQQLDWPFEAGTTRDGMPYPKKPQQTGDECNVVNRLPPFQYRYTDAGKVYPSPSGRTTLDEGGSCHMGRPARISGIIADTRLCRTVDKNYTHLVARCDMGSGVEQNVTMERELSKAPGWMIDHMQRERRQKCDQCSAVPEWKVEGKTATADLPAGPEVSYGLPFRWSASRLLAGDIRALICGSNHNSTSACAEMLDVSEWTLSKFISNMVSRPHLLFAAAVSDTFPATTTENITLDRLTGNDHDKPDEDALWNGEGAGWVACNKNSGSCHGGISKDDWYSPDRTNKCIDAFREQVGNGNVNTTTFGIDLCNLTPDLERMCKVLATAQVKVFDANCISTGACSPQVHVYAPAIYVTSNQDFVRGTVENFYEIYNLDPGDGTFLGAASEDNRVCPRSENHRALIESNERLTRYCAAKQIERVQDAIRTARRVVHTLVKAIFYVLNIVFTFLRLVFTTSADVIDDILAEIQFWFTSLMLLLYEAVEEIGNMIYRLVFDSGGFGTTVKNIIKEVCRVVNVFIDVWNHTGCVVLRDMVAPALQGTVGLIESVVGFTGFDASGLLSLIKKILAEIRGMTCENSIDCDFDDYGPPDLPDGTNPVASRCWADYVPTIDDTDSFACTRSDTCRVGEIYVGVSDLKRQVLCDNCPFQPGGLINQFGCDTYTKQCTCNRPIRDRTACVTNFECQFNSDESTSMCALVGDFTTGSSSGSLECNQCPSRPTCHITDGSLNAGTCTCMQRETPVQRCNPADAGRRVLPNSAGMCMVTMDLGAERSLNNFYDINSLATVPCVLINPSNAYCRNVQGQYLVVGHGTSPTDFIGTQGSRRRLLSTSIGVGGNWTATPTPQPPQQLDDRARLADLIHTALETDLPYPEAWTEEHVRSATCRMLAKDFTLMLANAEGCKCRGMSALDLSRLYHGCVEWRRAGGELAKELNLTESAGDAFLLSMDDLLHAVRQKEVVRALIRAPSRPNFWSAVGKLPGARHLRELFTRVAEGAVALYAEAWLNKFDMPRLMNESLRANLTSAEREALDYVNKNYEQIRHLIPFVQAVDTKVAGGIHVKGSPATGDGPAPRTADWPSNQSHHANESLVPTKIPPIYPPPPYTRGPSRRRLLQQQEGERDPVSDYSTLTAATSGFADIPLSNSVADSWLEGPFQWPPSFDYWEGDAQCTAAAVGLEIATTSGRVLKTYYTEDYPNKVNSISWSFRANEIKFYNGTPPTNDTLGSFAIDPTTRPPPPEGDWIANLYHFIGDNFLVQYLGIRPSDVQAFFVSGKGVPRDQLTLGNLAYELLVCDLESVVLCSKRERNLAISFLYAYVAYLAASTVFSLLNVRGVNTVLFLLLPFFTFWLAYGISPACTPMVPTCLFTDAMGVVRAVLPGKIIWPDALQFYPRCVGPSWIDEELARRNGDPPPTAQPDPRFPNIEPGSADCMLPCTGAPFHFTSWESTAAWVACGVDPVGCAGLSVPYFPEFRNAALNFSSVLLEADASGDMDRVHAFSFCFWMTFARAMPAVVIVLVASYAIFAALRVPMILVTAGVQLAAQAVAYSHVD